MTLGAGLFLSSLFLGTVFLFVATKDRWNWKRILLWPVLIAVGLSIVGGSGVYIYTRYLDTPKPQESFWDLSLNMPANDVRFLKGVPSQEGERAWVYRVDQSYNDASFHIVGFTNDQRVRFISYAGGDVYLAPSLEGIRLGDHLSKLLERFGEPSMVTEGKSGLERVYSYERLRLFFRLSAGRVKEYGVYDPTAGPMKLKGENGGATAP